MPWFRNLKNCKRANTLADNLLIILSSIFKNIGMSKEEHLHTPFYWNCISRKSIKTMMSWFRDLENFKSVNILANIPLIILPSLSKKKLNNVSSETVAYSIWVDIIMLYITRTKKSVSTTSWLLNLVSLRTTTLTSSQLIN